MVLSFSEIAFVGQTSMHPPQEWHISSKTMTSLVKASALKEQKSTHFLQPVQRLISIAGIFTVTSSLMTLFGWKNKCPFGSSTSQSAYTASLFIAARFTDTRVLPVPPLPLNTAIFIVYPLR